MKKIDGIAIQMVIVGVLLFVVCPIVILGMYDMSLRCGIEGCSNRQLLNHDYCEIHTCKTYYCFKAKNPSADYCQLHWEVEEAKRLKELEIYNKRPDCAIKGCEEKAESTSKYCINHMCWTFSCDYPVLTEESHFCTIHVCTRRGCYNKKADGEKYCERCLDIYFKETPKKNTSTYRSTKKNKVDMPDVDDYDDYEDFMDDWDGNIPGGLDADDYWDNW